MRISERVWAEATLRGAVFSSAGADGSAMVALGWASCDSSMADAAVCGVAVATALTKVRIVSASARTWSGSSIWKVASRRTSSSTRSRLPRPRSFSRWASGPLRRRASLPAALSSSSRSWETTATTFRSRDGESRLGIAEATMSIGGRSGIGRPDFAAGYHGLFEM